MSATPPPGFLAVFDFDHTVMDDNTDTVIQTITDKDGNVISGK